jgi:hypothetical protein
MSRVLQSEIRLHEGILAALTMQDSWSDRVQEQKALAQRMEHAIAQLKEAIQTDQARARIAPRLLPLLFNLQEALDGAKRSLQLVQAFAETLQNGDQDHRRFLESHAARLAESIEWMQELAETWSLSLDPSFQAEVERRLIDAPRPAAQIRDWQTVFDELARDTQTDAQIDAQIPD